MLAAMRLRWLVAVLFALTVALPAACGKSGSDSPFEGDWVSETGTRIMFSGSSWTDSDGDSGDFEYSGEYPVYTVIFVTDGASVFQRATFADTKTLELCLLYADGTVSDCQNLVFDRPTLH